MTDDRTYQERNAPYAEQDEGAIRAHYGRLADAAVERQRRWAALSANERHIVNCYAQQFGRRCRHPAHER